MIDRRDPFARLTVRALRRKTQGGRDPAVVLLGASGLRRSVDRLDDLRAGIRRHSGREYPVLDLTAGGLHILEYSAVVDALGADFEGVVVMSVSPVKLVGIRRFVKRAARSPRIGFRSVAMDGEIRRLGFTPRRVTGIYFLDNLGFFAARRSLALRPILGPDRSPPRKRRPLSPKRRAREIASSRDVLERYPEEGPEGLLLLEMVVAGLPAGARAALVQAPLNPELAAGLLDPPHRERYLADIDRLASRTGAAHWDVSSAAGLVAGDFRDLYHLESASAIERTTEVLSERVAGLLREMR